MIYYITKQKALFSSEDFIVTDDTKDLEEYCNRMLAIDTETKGLDPLVDPIVLLQLGDADNQFVLDVNTVLVPDSVKEYLEGKEHLKLLANAKFDDKMMKVHLDITMSRMYDIITADKIIMNGLQDWGFGLDKLSEKYLNEVMDKETQKSFVKSTALNERQIRYAANDVRNTFRIFSFQVPQIKKYSLEKVVKLENEACTFYADMELNGIKLDPERWMEIYKENIPILEKYMGLLDECIMRDDRLIPFRKPVTQGDLFNENVRKVAVNWNAPVTVLKVLQAYGIKVDSTERDVLEPLVYEDEVGKFFPIEEEHDLVATLLNYRTYHKATTTYGKKFLEKHLHPKTGRVHPNFNQMGAETGRISCSKPNMQNVKRGSSYRSAFIAEKGHKLITMDYSGCELRFIAEGSGDPVFVEAFKLGQDVHSRVASMLYGKEVTKSNENSHLRAPAKNLNFGLAYGMGPDKLAAKVGITKVEAMELMDLYFKTFPLIKKYLDHSGKFAVKNGYIRTPEPFGRIRWFKDHGEDMSWGVKGSIDRAGRNTPIQGANADLTKQATVLLGTYIRNENKYAGEVILKFVNQVHDEIVVEAKNEHAEKAFKDMIFLMEMAANDMMTKIDMIAEGSIDDCWSK